MDQTKQRKYDRLYLDIASRIATMSHAERLQVGAVAVKDGNILAFGFNGTPSGFDNCCEDRIPVRSSFTSLSDEFELKTKHSVIHAESNLIAKAARDGLSLKDATIYLTHSPCATCALLLIQTGISRVLYLKDYRLDLGTSLLKQANIRIEKYENQ